MINFLRNKYTIIFEIVILLLSILWYWQTREIEPIITFIGSLSFLIALLGNLKKKNIDEIGPKQKTLHRDFLYDYIPGDGYANKKWRQS